MSRPVDIVATLLMSPLIIVISIVTSLLTVIFSGLPIMFRQERAGRDKKPFILYKFRTMKTGIEAFGPSPKNGADPRLTRIGRFLRASSLDELPQFWNVLKGEMSLVGPRPLYMEQTDQWNERQRRRLEVRPGLTGLAQISGRGSLTHEEKLELDVIYVENRSFWLDCKIILLTVLRTLGGGGIYEKQYSKNETTRGQGKK
jgi:lipopolysaccharide/colanic/teichoic acid biosynthesis glycosyltransferase